MQSKWLDTHWSANNGKIALALQGFPGSRDRFRDVIAWNHTFKVFTKLSDENAAIPINPITNKQTNKQTNKTGQKLTSNTS